MRREKTIEQAFKAGLKPTRKALVKAGEAFVARVRAAVLALPGAYEADELHIAVQTKAGRLEISPYDTFIACGFDNVARARTMMGITHLHQGRLNPHSGKWNFGQGELFDLTVAERGPVEDRLVAELLHALSHYIVEGPVDTRAMRSWPWDPVIELSSPY